MNARWILNDASWARHSATRRHQLHEERGASPAGRLARGGATVLAEAHDHEVV
jgi:hypothetical protein